MRAPAWCAYSVSLCIQEDYSNEAIWVGITGLWTSSAFYMNFEYSLKQGPEHETFISQLCALASKAVMPFFLTSWINNLLLQSGTAPRGKIKAGHYSLLVKLLISN